MLTRRQLLAYTDLVDIFKPNAPAIEGEVVSDRTYPSTPTYPGVAGKYYQTDEMAPATPAGRMNRTNMLVIDKFHLPADTDVLNGYIVRLMTPGHPYYGYYWVLMGNAKRRISAGRRTANFVKVFAYRTPPPAGVTPPE